MTGQTNPSQSECPTAFRQRGLTAVRYLDVECLDCEAFDTYGGEEMVAYAEEHVAEHPTHSVRLTRKQTIVIEAKTDA